VLDLFFTLKCTKFNSTRAWGIRGGGAYRDPAGRIKAHQWMSPFSNWCQERVSTTE